MAKATFLHKDLSRAASFSGSTQVAGMTYATMLIDPQPRHRARVAATASNLIIDLGAGTAIDIAALISTTILNGDSVRLRMSLTDPTVTGSLLYDSGTVSGVTQNYYNGNVIMPLSASVTVRYIRWDITQASSPIDIGLCPCGLLFRPTHNFTWGAQEGRIDPSPRELNADTGAEFAVALPQKRFRYFTLPNLTQSETRATVDEMDRLAGAAGDILFIEDADAAALTRAQNAIWGAFRPATDSGGTRRFANLYGRDFKLVERL
jgi:hypothetical protein